VKISDIPWIAPLPTPPSKKGRNDKEILKENKRWKGKQLGK